MEYIATRRIKREKAACGIDLNIPRGKTFEEKNNMILMPDGRMICYATSELGHQYFARNDDGQGLYRGALTYAIAYGQRIRTNDTNTRRQRFTDNEINILERDWNKYLIQDIDVILFNHDFFNAEISELEAMAAAINIKIKE